MTGDATTEAPRTSDAPTFDELVRTMDHFRQTDKEIKARLAIAWATLRLPARLEGAEAMKAAALAELARICSFDLDIGTVEALSARDVVEKLK